MPDCETCAACGTREIDAATLEQRLAMLAGSPVSEATLQQAVAAIIRVLGFESFSYAVSSVDGRPHQDARSMMWTTLPPEWVLLYQRKRYVDIDPRLRQTSPRAVPYIWDAAQLTQGQAQPFLRDAARFGIASGVVVSFRDARDARVMVALNSKISPISCGRRTQMQRHLGDVMLLATCFHDAFTTHTTLDSAAAAASSARLSARERQCLQMAARGLTSADIGNKLGITERTANFHFSNVISKLGVINRHEAIARAVSSGIISVATI
ncbi:MAG: LuxR family transcriptional regulator [Pseudomonadota bacterium]|nr:LuxR family transcriptional regulator [Pseudomonadota bacterium]